MMRNMIDVISRILEESFRNNGLSIIEIAVVMDEVKIFIEEDEEMPDILMFAFDLAQNYECIVHVTEDVGGGEEVILVLNERYVPDSGIRVIIR